MSAAGRIDIRQIALICAHAMRHALRNGSGIFYVFVVMYFGLLFCFVSILPLEQIRAEARLRNEPMASQRNIIDNFLEEEAVKENVNRFLGGGKLTQDPTDEEIERYREAEDWRVFLVKDHPAVLSAMFLLLSYALPLFIVVGAFNQFSGDVQSFALRYQLLRTSRANLYIGRFLATTFFSIATMLVLVSVVIAYLGLKLDFYSWSEILPWGGRGILTLVVLTFPYVAICQMVSCWIDSAFGSLLLCSAVISAVPAIALGGFMAWEPMIDAAWIMPWALHHYFFTPSPLVLTEVVLASFGYTALYLGLGYWRFAKRDL